MKELERTKEKAEVDEFRRRMLAKFSGREVGPGTSCLLLDRSGSMCCPIGDKSFRSTRIEELRKLAGQFIDVRRFQYNGTIEELKPTETIGDAEGDNNEVLAFETLKNLGVTNVVLITDGGADQPERALRAAVGLKIDIFYIGPDPPPKFIFDLARQTGGSCNPKADLIQMKSLVGQVKDKLAIEAPKGPIQL